MGKAATEDKPLPPKKALTAFFLFRGEVYDDVKLKNPNSKITELTKIIGQMWFKADPETKSRLEKEYQKNKIKYEEEKQTYIQNYGKIESKKKKVGKGKQRK